MQTKSRELTKLNITGHGLILCSHLFWEEKAKQKGVRKSGVVYNAETGEFLSIDDSIKYLKKQIQMEIKKAKSFQAQRVLK